MKFISLFAGIGGFDLGLERAGMQCVGQVEYNPFCQRVLKHHWPHVKLVGDIHNVTGESFDPVRLICGGFPCQPFSNAGKRKGKEDDRYLWPEMLRVIQAYRPAWVLGENVAGIVNMELDNVLSDLEGEGYEVQAFIIPACAVDAKHERKRVWIVANSQSRRIRPRFCEDRQEQNGDKSSNGGSYVSNPNSSGLGERRWPESIQPEQCAAQCSGQDATHTDSRAAVTDAGNNAEMRGFSQEKCKPKYGSALSAGGCRWITEPRLGRVANGVPGRVDRLRSLGNAVVPQVVEVIGRAIMQAEEAASCGEERPGEHFGSAIYRQPTAAAVNAG